MEKVAAGDGKRQQQEENGSREDRVAVERMKKGFTFTKRQTKEPCLLERSQTNRTVMKIQPEY